MDTIRTFIAVPLPESVTAHLADLAAAMAQSWDPGAVRWVRPENMHLTLRFLGHTNPELVPTLSAALAEVTADTRAFELALAGSGCVPSVRRPRVIWIELGDSEGKLSKLQQAVEQMVRGHGWKREGRKFRPHLTLGRVRDRATVPSSSWLAEPEPMAVPVQEVRLIESRLKSAGAEYHTLFRAVLPL